MTFLVNKGRVQPRIGCDFSEPPEFECRDMECIPCDDNACGTCPPKTRAKDSEAIGLNECSRCVSLRGRGCSPRQLPAFMHCIELQVRRKGTCKVITKEVPYKATYEGAACFNWSKRFKALADGYYEADVYINGKSCYTWAFHIEGCYVQMDTVSTEEDTRCTTCNSADPCGCYANCKTPLEEVIEDVTVDGDCGGCKSC